MKKGKGMAEACTHCICMDCPKSCLCWACDADKPGVGPMISKPCREKEKLNERGERICR